MGIGLSLVPAGELHDGTVSTATPGIGLGSSFTISLPLAAVNGLLRQATLAGVCTTPAAVDRMPATWLCVLITDDNDDVCTTTISQAKRKPISLGYPLAKSDQTVFDPLYNR